MVSEQQTFLSKLAQGALASAVALQLAQPVPVGALTPVDAASLSDAVAAKAEAAKEARAEVEAAEAEAAKAQAEAAAASAAQKAFESTLAANKPFESSLDLGYDAAYAAALTKARAEAGLTMAAPASTDSGALGLLSGVDGKVVVLPLVAGLALFSVNEASKSSGMGSDWFKLSSLSKPFADGAPPGRGAAAGQQQRNAPDILLGGLDNLSKDPLGWCFGPPSPLHSNAGAAPAAGFAPPSQDATRDGEQEVYAIQEVYAAKAAWLAKQSGFQPPAQQPWQAQAPAPAPAAAPAYAPPPAPAYAPPRRGAAAGQQRSAPDILLGGLDNLSKDPLGWCFGPPSPLYSNAGAAPAAGPPAAGFQPPTAGGGASQAYRAESAPAPEATRDGEEEAAKAAWLAKQNWPRSGQ